MLTWQEKFKASHLTRTATILPNKKSAHFFVVSAKLGSFQVNMLPFSVLMGWLVLTWKARTSWGTNFLMAKKRSTPNYECNLYRALKGRRYRDGQKDRSLVAWSRALILAPGESSHNLMSNFWAHFYQILGIMKPCNYHPNYLKSHKKHFRLRKVSRSVDSFFCRRPKLAKLALRSRSRLLRTRMERTLPTMPMVPQIGSRNPSNLDSIQRCREISRQKFLGEILLWYFTSLLWNLTTALNSVPEERLRLQRALLLGSRRSLRRQGGV